MAEADTGAVTLREGKMTKEIIRKKEEKQNKKKRPEDHNRFSSSTHRPKVDRKCFASNFACFSFLKLCKNTKKGGKPKDSFFSFFLLSLNMLFN